MAVNSTFSAFDYHVVTIILFLQSWSLLAPQTSSIPNECDTINQHAFVPIVRRLQFIPISPSGTIVFSVSQQGAERLQTNDIVVHNQATHEHHAQLCIIFRYRGID
ncbi:hypothetical protein F5890DRAFT_1507550 [Lentinula detonsa]|uniref:Uncharacterized protein n=1 Tax=Lentinula detonsa TaxID=2804962 RepID=A0AA38UT46_9AGAR|nr:hypothetical protein F5890DRAFT_1507550 [Lentinula detonsa]